MAAKVEKGLQVISSADSVDVHPSAGGFMLLDMALALTILLIISAIVWPFVRSTSSTQQAATALDIATLLRTDRSSAHNRGIPTGTRIDLDQRQITGSTGRRVAVPTDLAIEVTTGPKCIEGSQKFLIVFAPDGSSCGGVVTLSKRGQAYAIRINWLSGMIDVISLPKA
jgi:general secretion pathway protein H